MLLEGIIEDLLVFKRALRREDNLAFDSLMNKARKMDAVFLSVLVEQEKEIISLRRSLQRIPNSCHKISNEKIQN